MTFVLVLALIFCWLPATPSFAVDEEPAVAIGYLIKKMAQQIVLEEFPSDSEDPIEVTYAVDENTRFTNFESLDDINEFDDLEVQYKMVGSQRVALVIFRSQAFDEFEGGLEVEDEPAEEVNVDSYEG